MTEHGTGQPIAVVLARHVGRDPGTLRIEREGRADNIRLAGRILTHLAEERATPVITELPRGRVQARWSMSSGVRLQLAWGEEEGPLGVSLAHLPNPVLDTFSAGTGLDREAPWKTAGIIGQRCITAAEAIVAADDSEMIASGRRLELALSGWLAHLEDETGLREMRTAAASPWNSGMAWNGDVGPRIIDHAALGLPEPAGRGVAMIDVDGVTVMGSIIVQTGPATPMERLRAMAAYREAIA